MCNLSRATFILSVALVSAAVSACADTDSSSTSQDRLDINPAARTLAHSTLEIQAPPGDVWAALVDVERWTEWLPFQRAHLDGPLAAGSVIRWSLSGAPIDSRLVLVESEHRLVWNGTDGAVHVWELVPTDQGTHLNNNESIDDWRDNTSEHSSEELTSTLQGWNQLLAQRVHVLREQGGAQP